MQPLISMTSNSNPMLKLLYILNGGSFNQRCILQLYIQFEGSIEFYKAPQIKFTYLKTLSHRMIELNDYQYFTYISIGIDSVSLRKKTTIKNKLCNYFFIVIKKNLVLHINHLYTYVISYCVYLLIAYITSKNLNFFFLKSIFRYIFKNYLFTISLDSLIV